MHKVFFLGGKRMRGTILGLALLTAVMALLLPTIVHANTIYWTDWTTLHYGQPGTASGTITFPSRLVTVSYSGDLFNDPIPGAWSPASTFQHSPQVDNAPPDSNNIAMTGGYSFLYTLSFSNPVTNPVIAVLSLGGSGTAASMQFTTSFSILNSGPNSTYNENGPFYSDGNTLWGQGGNGIIQFSGTYNSISWYSPNYEYWYMFTVGAPSPVPIPSTVVLLCSGLLGLAGWRRFTKG